MIDKDDLRYIHHDLSDLVEELVEKEEYEKCKLASDYKSMIEKYLAGMIEENEMINPLLEICFSRYTLFRLLSVKATRYAVFLLPNSSMISFNVEPDVGEPSYTWKKLHNEYERMTREVTKSITRTMSHE